MTADDLDARLTAFALNDPGLSAADRRDLETLIETDPSARSAVEETRHLARLLTDGLAAEQAAMPADKPVTIPAVATTPQPRGWVRYVVAAAVLIAVGGGSLVTWKVWKAERDARDERHAALTADNERRQRDLATREATGTLDPAEWGRETRTKVLTVSRDAADAEKSEKLTDESKKHARENTDLPNDAAPGTPTAGSGAPTPDLRVPGGPPSPPAKSGAKGKDSSPKPIAPGDPAPGLGGPAPGPGGPPGRPGGVPSLPEAPPVLPAPIPPPYKTAPQSPAPATNSPPRPEGGEGKPDPRRDPKPEAEGDGKGDKGAKADKDPKDTPAPVTSPDQPAAEPVANDRFPRLTENGFVKVEGMNALSTFGVDVDTASYAIVRKYLTIGQLPPANAVRLEELVNYFPYQDKAPAGDDPFAVTVEMAECPWQPAHRLVRLGLKARPIDVEKRPVSNLVFLIDVSGSMNEPNKLPLVKESLKLLVQQLGENDRVAMVVYAGASGLVLDSTSAVKKDKIVAALDNLSAGGSTNGAGGIQQAYDVAAANFIKGGTNRVILCTDGDWNVGTTSTEGLVGLIEKKRETGVYLSVFGFGMGNLRDEMMVKLAGKGNGNYGYIDTIREAQKALVEQLSGTLVTVAKDVKVQVEFNPAAIQSYRLLGYEKRHLEARDFHDDKKDAGEMGAGHVVTALYELVPVGVAVPGAGKVDGLRYQPDPAAPKAVVKGEKATEAFVVKMRHKKPDGDKSTLRELPVSNMAKGYEQASEDFRFSAAVASFAMLLRDSPYKGNANYAVTLELAEAAKKHDPNGHRAEFVDLVKKAKALSGKP